VVPLATGVLKQPSVASQVSAVQGLSSSQMTAAPGAQAPEPLQASDSVQAVPSEQAAPAGANVSVGQVVASPVQLSATSQSPAAARHTVDDGWYAATQVASAPVLPEQVS
jgi:hypothetical protein